MSAQFDNSQTDDGYFLFEEIPKKFFQMPAKELHQWCMDAKAKLGKDLLILAHHYQQNDTYALSDATGDSLYLAQQAAKTDAKYILFCGVHFMAEAADILTSDEQIAILPNLTAGCSMADMADEDAVEAAFELIEEISGEEVLPITYINSTAALKALVAQKGGTVCTSSNAGNILEWALKQNKKIVFLPDQHLGRNTAKAMGIPPEQMPLWDRLKDDGGLSDQQIKDSKIILWDGFCSVHQRFTVQHIENIRKRIPDIQVIVHPECPEPTVDAADFSGSTNQILKKIEEAPNGTKWAVGTEINMVNRMAKDFAPDKYIEVLNPNVCICSTMYRNHPAHVAWVLENLLEGKVIHQIKVPDDIKVLAKQALEKMLELS